MTVEIITFKFTFTKNLPIGDPLLDSDAKLRKTDNGDEELLVLSLVGVAAAAAPAGVLTVGEAGAGPPKDSFNFSITEIFQELEI